MRKKFLSLSLAFTMLFLLPLGLVQAEQFDHLVELPVDENQEAVIEGEVTEEAVWHSADGEVLGTQDDFIYNEQDRGPHFYFGEEMVIDEDLVGDVYAFAGNVEVNGRIDGDLLVAGGNVTLNGEVTQDVRAAGGNVFVNGIIGQNLSLAGGMIRFTDTASVGNSLLVGGGSVSLDGEVVGNVFLGGGAARLAGKYGSNINAAADDFEVMPGVMVAGSLMAEAGSRAEISDEAEIIGEENVRVVPQEEKYAKSYDDKMAAVGGVLVKAQALGFIVKLIIGFVSGSILLYFVPKLAMKLSTSVLDMTMANMGWGFIYLMLTPFVVILTMASVVALPIAGIIVLFYIFSFIVAKWIVAYALGNKMYSQFKWSFMKNKYLAFMVGLLTLSLISAIPVLGWVVSFLAFLVGMGAVFSLVRSNVLSRKK